MTGERGFTIVEVIIAVVVLSVGLLGLVSTAALTTRMIGQGQRYSEAAALASQRFEILRGENDATCSRIVNGSSVVGATQLSWTVTSVQAGRARQVALNVVYQTGRGPRTERFQTIIFCR